MEYRGFKIINEYKEASPGAWRAYMIEDPEVVCEGRTELELMCEIGDIIWDRANNRSANEILNTLNNSIMFEDCKKHLRNMMGAMDEFMGREELLDRDTASQYLAAAKFCNSEFGTGYRTHHVEEWIENELNK